MGVQFSECSREEMAGKLQTVSCLESAFEGKRKRKGKEREWE